MFVVVVYFFLRKKKFNTNDHTMGSHLLFMWNHHPQVCDLVLLIVLRARSVILSGCLLGVIHELSNVGVVVTFKVIVIYLST